MMVMTIACVQALLAGLGYTLGKEKMSRCEKRAEGGTGRLGEEISPPPTSHTISPNPQGEPACRL